MIAHVAISQMGSLERTILHRFAFITVFSTFVNYCRDLAEIDMRSELSKIGSLDS